MDGSEREVDLVLIQTFFALLWKLFLKNTSKHKNNLIYIIKQEGLYQKRSNPALLPYITVKWPIETYYVCPLYVLERGNRLVLIIRTLDERA